MFERRKVSEGVTLLKGAIKNNHYYIIGKKNTVAGITSNITPMNKVCDGMK